LAAFGGSQRTLNLKVLWPVFSRKKRVASDENSVIKFLGLMRCWPVADVARSALKRSGVAPEQANAPDPHQRGFYPQSLARAGDWRRYTASDKRGEDVACVAIVEVARVE
jgi:hypothetical protein